MGGRSLSAVSLHPTNNLHGSINVLLLGSNKIVTRDNYTIMNNTTPFIDHMNDMCDNNVFRIKRDVVLDEVLMFDTTEELYYDQSIFMGPEVNNNTNDPNYDGVADHESEFEVSPQPPQPLQSSSEPIQGVYEDDGDNHSEGYYDDPMMDPELDDDDDFSDSDDVVDNDDYEHAAGGGADQDAVMDDNAEDDIPPSISTTPTTEQNDHGYNLRSKGRISATMLKHVNNVSMKKMREKHSDEAIEATLLQLNSIVQMGTLNAVRFNDLTPCQRKKLIRSQLFITEKRDARGNFIKFKARLVLNGSQQNREDYEQKDISSPTASIVSLFILICIAVYQCRFFMTMDIVAAYLNAKMEPDTI
jgi:hypothetical protein